MPPGRLLYVLRVVDGYSLGRTNDGEKATFLLKSWLLAEFDAVAYGKFGKQRLRKFVVFGSLAYLSQQKEALPLVCYRCQKGLGENSWVNIPSRGSSRKFNRHLICSITASNYSQLLVGFFPQADAKAKLFSAAKLTA